MWAYLPVGPLERHDWEGGLRGFWEEVHSGPSKGNGYLSWMGQLRGSLCLLNSEMRQF